MLNRLFITICFAVVVLCSCSNNDIFLQYRDIPQENWHRDSICTFNVPVENISYKYNVYVNVRNTANYADQNLWLFLEINYPDNTTIKDTINFFLADERGKWLGTGIGNSYNMPVLYLNEKKFPQEGNYTFKIRHAMRYDWLRGINNVGLRVEKTPLQ